MINKFFFVLGLFLLGSFVVGQTPDVFLSQAQVDAIDFNSLNLQYTFSAIELNRFDNDWVLTTTTNYLTLFPSVTDVNSNKRYQVGFASSNFYYSASDFFNCFLSNNDVTCFLTFVVPVWVDKFLIDDMLQRRYLKSLQTDGNAMISSGLKNYFV